MDILRTFFLKLVEPMDEAFWAIWGCNELKSRQKHFSFCIKKQNRKGETKKAFSIDYFFNLYCWLIAENSKQYIIGEILIFGKAQNA